MALRKSITPSWAREWTAATARQARFRSWVFFFLRAVGSLCSSPKERNTPYSLKGIVLRAWARLAPTYHPPLRGQDKAASTATLWAEERGSQAKGRQEAWTRCSLQLRSNRRSMS